MTVYTAFKAKPRVTTLEAQSTSSITKITWQVGGLGFRVVVLGLEFRVLGGLRFRVLGIWDFGFVFTSAANAAVCRLSAQAEIESTHSKHLRRLSVPKR